MRILALNWQDLKNPQSGGAEVHLEEILRRLVSFGHQVDLLCCNFPGGSNSDNVGGVRIFRRGKRWNFNLAAPFAIKEIMNSNKYDVLLEDINKIPFYSPLYQKLPTLVVIPHLFSDTIFKDSNRFVINDTISRNKIQSRGFEALLAEKTIIRNNYIFTKEKGALYIGGFTSYDRRDGKLGLGLGLNYKTPKKDIFSLGYSTNVLTIGYSKKIY